MNYLLSLLNLAALFGALAALQALLLNRLGLAFAAMTAFLGLGAYGVATYQIGPGVSILFFASAMLLAWVMAHLAYRLRGDYFLLATLAVLECLGAVVSATPGLGGREGLPLAPAAELGGSHFELRMLLPTAGALSVVVAVCAFVLSSAAGVAIDRFREHQETAARWFPVRRLLLFSVLLAAFLGLAVGAVYITYVGRVTPRVFSIDLAILVLMFTVLAGKRPALAALGALLYWVLPYWASSLLPLSRQGAADGVRMLWGLLVILAVLIPGAIERRRLARLEPEEVTYGAAAS